MVDAYGNVESHLVRLAQPDLLVRCELFKSDMFTLQEILASYVPSLVVRRFVADPAPLSEPELARFPAAVLFTDISGFTPLAERLAQHGPVGAEELSRLLNAYFEQLIALIATHGGEVVKFAGDALLALWSDRNEDLAAMTHRAAQCGLAVQAIFHDYKAADSVRLSTRMGIGAGEVSAMHVGGVEGRWHFLVAGAPLNQIGTAQQHAQPGEVVLSPEAWGHVQDTCKGQARGGGCTRLEAIRTPLPLNTTSLLLPAPQADAALRTYIPDAVLSRLAAGQAEWLAELRQVTVLFIKLVELDHAALGVLEQAQAIMGVVQPLLRRYEGSLKELVVDDKGTTLVAVFGLPPLVHEDDPVRGVQVAVAAQAALRKLVGGGPAPSA